MISARVRRTVVALAAVAVIAGSAGSGFCWLGAPKDGERLRTLLGGKTGKTGQLPELTAQPTGLLLSRTGIQTDVLKGLSRYDVEAPGETSVVHAAFIDFTWRGRQLRLGALAQGPGLPRALTAFDDFGKPVPELDPFLKQFKVADGVLITDGSLAPIGDAMKLRDSIVKQKDPPAKPQEYEKWALFRHKLLMWQMDDVASRAIGQDADSANLAGALAALVKQTDLTNEFATHLKTVMKPKDVGQYRKMLANLKAGAEEARAAADAGKLDDAAKIAKAKVKTACAQCHGSDANDWKKPLKGAIRARREEVGFANGAFVVDYDVRRGDLPADEAQTIASAVKAVLLLAQGK